jgi:hypothetical protein
MAQDPTITPSDAVRPVEYVSVHNLQPHPRNYKVHTPEQMDHLKASITEHGVYHNIVVAREGTILAGHGVYQACQELGIEVIPVTRLNVDPEDPRALKVLAGDNEISRLAQTDMDLLADIMGLIHDDDPDGLTGTGFDEGSFASLIAMTAGSPEEFDVEGEWEGMPEYDMENVGDPTKTIIINFATPEDVEEFSRVVGQTVTMATRSIWFPPKDAVRTTHLAVVGEQGQ